jgi:hypothetical protein
MSEVVGNLWFDGREAEIGFSYRVSQGCTEFGRSKCRRYDSFGPCGFTRSTPTNTMNKLNHQYSGRVALPVKLAYFV